MAGAPGVAWTKDLAGETGAGVYVFTGKAAISLANDITLEAIPISRVEAVSKLVQPAAARPTTPACADLRHDARCSLPAPNAAPVS